MCLWFFPSLAGAGCGRPGSQAAQSQRSVPVNAFIDPRADPDPHASKSSARTTTEPEQLTELHRLCREGRLFDVEQWIRSSRPLQVIEGAPAKRRRVTSALEITLDRQNQALVLLLLYNGYDSNLEPRCPLDLALRARRWDLIDLLLEWGADPHQLSLSDLFDTYNSKLLERFRALGVDLTADHELAEALAYHTSNKPLFGFAKRHREHDPNIQTELNIALAHHAGDGNDRGVKLCLWAGADPHAPACSLRYSCYCDQDDAETEEEDRFLGYSAVYEACRNGDIPILKRLGPDPSCDDFGELYRAARNGAVVDLLACLAPPGDVGALIHYHIWWLSAGFNEWRPVDTLRHLFKVGARRESSSREEAASVRRLLLKMSDNTFVDLMKLLAEDAHCSPEILKELARTPSLRTRMKKVGFFPPSPGDLINPYQRRPTRSREVLSKFGVEIPKPKKPNPPLPRSVQIGPWRSNGREIRLDRGALFERVWTEPVATLAEKWGLSGPGLAKACRRLQVPVPPRGFWAKAEAGQRVRRPQLPKLPPDEATVIVIRAPE